jgi:hypothetical protein
MLGSSYEMMLLCFICMSFLPRFGFSLMNWYKYDCSCRIPPLMYSLFFRLLSGILSVSLLLPSLEHTRVLSLLCALILVGPF